MKTKITNYFSRVSIVFKKSQSALQLIQNLNPLLRGWRNYYKFSDARTYGSLPGVWDSRINIKCRHWIKRNCNRYGRNPIFSTQIKKNNWVFYADDPKTKKRLYINKHSWVSWSLQAYNRIDSNKSPYDGDVRYWSLHSGIRTMGISSPKREYLLKIQEGKCLICLKLFTPENLPFSEIHHKKERKREGMKLGIIPVYCIKNVI